ncbi:MAG: bifunctional precorrin-2 dehydrogenase/sirohydrochlorin ferrochelatase [Desulfosarcinaceae bacterium]|nr:bifunctional precorrin-2 dehydrogenase/sirohydrochlorin ferrochelatase [Desulfosarcinaceae bacterium]
MRYYPLCIDLDGRTCLVVGGGRVGARKVKRLLASGARVTVISPKMTADLEALGSHERLTLEKRPYSALDMKDAFLVFAATNDGALNRRIRQEAARQRILCNIADQPELCDFILPAVVNQGDLTLAITTAGSSPALAKRLRRQLASQFGPEYARLTALLGAIRRRLLAEGHDPDGHRQRFNALLDGGLLELLKENRTAEVDALLAAVLGPDYDLEGLLAE